MSEFIRAMYEHVPSGAKILISQFRGDPNDDIKGKWVAKPLLRPDQIDEQANVYLTVSAMKRNGRGEFRRRKENFAGGVLLMIDDLGDGVGSKFPLTTVGGLDPTSLIETSPGNYQAVYMFNQLVTDEALFDRLIKAFIERQFLGADTGMAGINRVFRPPHGINGKIKYHGSTTPEGDWVIGGGVVEPWRVRLAEWRPEARYSPQEIAEHFRLDIVPRRAERPTGATSDKAESIRRFALVRQAMRAAEMIKREDSDLAGWADVVCPWTDEHTGAVDNGAAIREPAEENGWVGAFKCFHGSCINRGWRDLTEWLAAEQEQILEMINKNDKGFNYYNDRQRT